MEISYGSRSISGPGIGFFSMLFLIFLTLKLTGVIAWSWWLVTMPLYGPLAFLAALFFVAMAIMLAAAALQKTR